MAREVRFHSRLFLPTVGQKGAELLAGMLTGRMAAGSSDDGWLESRQSREMRTRDDTY